MGNGFVDDNSSLFLQDLFQSPQAVHHHDRVLVTKQAVQLIHQRTICKEAKVLHPIFSPYSSLWHSHVELRVMGWMVRCDAGPSLPAMLSPGLFPSSSSSCPRPRGGPGSPGQPKPTCHVPPCPTTAQRLPAHPLRRLLAACAPWHSPAQQSCARRTLCPAGRSGGAAARIPACRASCGQQGGVIGGPSSEGGLGGAGAGAGGRGWGTREEMAWDGDRGEGAGAQMTEESPEPRTHLRSQRPRSARPRTAGLGSAQSRRSVLTASSARRGMRGACAHTYSCTNFFCTTSAAAPAFTISANSPDTSAPCVMSLRRRQRGRQPTPALR